MKKTTRKWPWIGKQTWENIIFLHWSVPYAKIRPYIPEPLILETFQHRSWISMVVFTAKNSQFRNFPLAYRPMVQVNIRTYVRMPNEERGVYFFSLHVNSQWASRGGKAFFFLPFHFLKMIEKTHAYRSESVASQPCLELKFNYTPLSHIEKDSLAYFLTERYCIWTIRNQKIIKIPITHSPWILQDMRMELKALEVYPPFLQPYMQAPPTLVHYCSKKSAKLYPYETVGLEGTTK